MVRVLVVDGDALIEDVLGDFVVVAFDREVQRADAVGVQEVDVGTFLLELLQDC